MFELTHRAAWAACLVTGLFTFADSAAAETGHPFAGNRTLPWYLDQQHGWQLDLGVELGWEPDYVGSDDNAFEAFPNLVLHYVANDDWRFRLTPETFAFVRDLGQQTLVQLVLELEEGRQASESEDLRALADGRDTVEAEVSLLRRFGSAFAYATWQPEIRDRDKGVVYFIGAGWQTRLGPRLLLTPTLDLSWGDGEHMRTEFGLTAADAALLNVQPYDADGGLKSSTFTLNAQWDPTPRLSLQASAGVEYYFDNAADSPLIEELGTRAGFEVEVTLLYAF